MRFQYALVINMANTLKQNLVERSLEIKMEVEKELQALDTPCTVGDLVKRVKASRMPVEKHLRFLLAQPAYADLNIIRLGTVDVLYRVCKKAPVQAPSQTATAPSQDAQGPDKEEN